MVLRSLGRSPNEAELDDIIKEFDPDGNTLLDFTAFLGVMGKNTNTVTSPEVLEAFKVFDLDNNGYVTAKELHAVMFSLAGLSDRLSHDDIEDMIREADTNEDGRINYAEFAKLVAK